MVCVSAEDERHSKAAFTEYEILHLTCSTRSKDSIPSDDRWAARDPVFAFNRSTRRACNPAEWPAGPADFIFVPEDGGRRKAAFTELASNWHPCSSRVEST